VNQQSGESVGELDVIISVFVDDVAIGYAKLVNLAPEVAP
jgi:hypothetical protein